MRPHRSFLALLAVALMLPLTGVTAADGAQRPPRLRFATFLGGTGQDRVEGMVVDAVGDILVTGTSSFDDFPIVAAPWPERPPGSNGGFLAKIHSSGSRLLFSTWFPVDGSLRPMALATDPDRNIYVAGETTSGDLPLVNPVQERQDPDTTTGDAFLMKLSPDGSELLMSTYVGALGRDLALALTVDDAGVAFLTGYTESLDFPAQRTFGRVGGPEGNVFVVGIDTVAGEVTMSALLAGERFERADAIAVDADSVWVGGSSQSRSFPVRRAFRRRVPNGFGGFVSRLDRDGRLLMSTRLRGRAAPRLERVTDIALDADGHAWVAGRGAGEHFPVVGDQEGVGRCPDGVTETTFLAHLHRRGRRMLGGGCFAPAARGDVLFGDLEVLPDGRLALAGGTDGPGFPLRRSLLPALAGRLDVFVAILDPARGTLELSSVYGARRGEFATDVGVGPDGRIVVAGQTGTNRFPVLRALQPEKASRAGVWDAFLLKIRP